MKITQLAVAGIYDNLQPTEVAGGVTFDLALADAVTQRRLEYRITVTDITKPDTYCAIVCDDDRKIIGESKEIEITQKQIDEIPNLTVHVSVFVNSGRQTGSVRFLRAADLFSLMGRSTAEVPQKAKQGRVRKHPRG